MPRAIWSGSISFGLVNVPVKVYSAMDEQSLHFKQFQEGTNARIRNKRVSEKTGKEVPYEKIEKGYEVSKGNFVVIDPKELEEFQPRATKTIDIEDFVELAAIDPVYYDRTYWLAPSGGEGAEKAYALLRQAMEKKERVAIGRVVMRTKQYLAAIRPRDGALALSTMLFHDEVVPKSEVEGIPSARKKASDKEVKMAEQIIDSLTSDWKPGKYHDTYRERVLEYIEQKAKGEEIVREEPEEENDGKVVDLLAALEASLEAAKKGRSAGKKKAAASR
jgi:DNA end-binding protein Ku